MALTIEDLNSFKRLLETTTNALGTANASNAAQYDVLTGETSKGCQALGTVLGGLGETVAESVDKIQSTVVAVLNDVGEALKNVNVVAEKIKWALSKCVTAIDVLINKFDKLTTAVLTALAPLMRIISQLFTTAVLKIAAVVNHINSAIEVVSAAVGVVLTSAGKVVSAVVNAGCGLVVAGINEVRGISHNADQVIKAQEGETPYSPTMVNSVVRDCYATGNASEITWNTLKENLISIGPSSTEIASLDSTAHTLSSLASLA